MATQLLAPGHARIKLQFKPPLTFTMRVWPCWHRANRVKPVGTEQFHRRESTSKPGQPDRDHSPSIGQQGCQVLATKLLSWGLATEDPHHVMFHVKPNV